MVTSGMHDEALVVANGIQRMRYERFNEQISGMVDTLTLEIDELEAQATATIRGKTLLLIGASAAILVMIVVLALLLTRAITAPLARGVEFAETVAEGDLTSLLEVQSRDEIGQLSAALNTMVAGLGGLVQRISASSEELNRIAQSITSASGRVVAAAARQGDNVNETSAAISEINASIHHVADGVDSLSQLAADNTTSILEMAASIEEVAHNAEALTQAVEAVSASITEMTASLTQVAGSAISLRDAAVITASSVTEMDASIQEVEQNAATTASIAEDVRRDAVAGKEAVDSTISGMHQIRQTSRVTAEVIESLSGKAANIGAILSVIDDVVSQINLLALNAAIIAAQAGEHGRGFSVVADEIKELAERTGGSTKEIANVIRAVQDETERAVKAIQQTETAIGNGETLSQQSGERLNLIVAGAVNATRQTGEIARASREQARGIQTIKRSMEQIADMVGQVASATGQQEKGSSQIATAAERMRNLALQVKSSTREQSRASGSIASATESMTAMVRQIQRACEEQTRGSSHIAQAAEGIRDATDVNREATLALNTAVGDLQQQTASLRHEMTAFRVTRPADEPAS
jgi:methyl-accepting chemotaxis protein